MKKLLMLACGICIAASAFAQEQVLKEADRMLKVEVPDHAKIASMLKQAMADPSTANNVKTWYLAGKNGIQTWQTGYELYMRGDRDKVDEVNMSRSLLEGYDFLSKAITMDTVVDAKGKVKTKYSKDIVKMIAENGVKGNFKMAASFLSDAKDMNAAYRALEIDMELPNLAFLGKSAPLPDLDSIRCMNYNYMGQLAYFANPPMKAEAAEAWRNAGRLGNEECYDNAIAVASEIGDRELIESIANEAFAKYGKQSYIAALINLYVKEKEYDKALDMVNKAMVTNPDNAVLYNAKGILVENQVNEEGIAPEVAEAANAEALQLYKRASELDPNNAESHYHYGRMLANSAYKISDSDEVSQLSAVEYNKLREEKILPIFKQAAEELEKCIAIDKEANRQAFSILRNLYYNLGDEENMNRVTELERE